MCGFLGEFCFNNAKVTSEDSFNTLLELSKHRGPDATEVYRAEQYQLGFNRLAILDLSERGNQPKQSPSGRYKVVFNGEIYNYQDLAETYNLKNLRSTSDTEVLVSLFDLLGVRETVVLLNGMFAIAVLDTELNSFYLTRDFAGIKPLFYSIGYSGLVAASQFDQVFKHEWINDTLKLKPEVVKDYFGFGYMQAPNTIYDTIFQVCPGEFIKIDREGDLESEFLTIFPNAQSKASNKSTLDAVLKNAVKRQLVSDVSVATFLSGGIDSPLISAYAKEEKDNIEAFTVKVDHPEFNESDIARSYAEHLNIKQDIFSLTESDILAHVDDHFMAYPEPFGDYSSIPTYVITKEAKKRHTVMLSGDGGDELFFGYPRMLDVLNKRMWFKFPFFIRKAIAKVTNTLGITKTWAPYFKSLDDFIMNKHIHLPSNVMDKAFKEVDYSILMKTQYRFKNSSKENLLHQLRVNEFYAHMQRILVKVDRASMKHSLEVRVPFLDKSCIQHAWNIKGSLETKADLKKELKQELAKKVPKEIINKKKMGFTVPLLEWLRNELKQDVIDHVLEKPFYGESIFNVHVLKNYTEDFYNKKHNDAWGIWHIYAWQKWATIHV